MREWLIQVGISLSQAALLTAAIWSWSALSSVLIAKVVSSAGFLTATLRSLWVAGSTTVIVVPAATIDIYFFPRAELLGIDHLVITPPYIWWAWGALLLCEPLVSGIKVIYLQPLLRTAAMRNNGPQEMKPKWVKLFEGLLGDLLNMGNYVRR